MALTPLEHRRTARHLNLPGFGPEQQERLHSAHVLVIGAGGLGCPLMQSLAAVGVGHITVIDDDTVDLTNIHRQILFGTDDVGKPKVDVAAARLRQIQPDIQVTAINGRFDTETAPSLLEGIDLLIDGSDTFATKYCSADASEIFGVPLLWGTVLRYAGQVAVWADGVGLRDLFPEQPRADSVPDCATAGVLGVTTAVVGNLMATEAVKYLAGIGEVVPGKVSSYNALDNSIQTFTVTADPGRDRVTSFGVYEEPSCALPDPEAERLLHLVIAGQAVALDIREPHERILADLDLPESSHHLPLSATEDDEAIVDKLATLSHDRVVVYCAGGVRSARFVEQYRRDAAAHGIELLSLPGGVQGAV